MEFTITLPWPPSLNKLWRIGRGKIYCSKEGVSFKEYVRFLCRAKKAPRFAETDRLKLGLWLYPPNKRVLDIDNRAKIVLDSLQDAGVIPNDSQIDKIWIERKEIFKGGQAIVKIVSL